MQAHPHTHTLTHTRTVTQALGCVLFSLSFFKHPFMNAGSLAILNGRFSPKLHNSPPLSLSSATHIPPTPSRSPTSPYLLHRYDIPAKVKRSQAMIDCFARFIFVHMHTCIHTYTHTCIQTYMHTCIHAYMHTYIHTHTCIQKCMHTEIHMCMHACVDLHVETGMRGICMHACTCIPTQLFRHQSGSSCERVRVARACSGIFPHPCTHTHSPSYSPSHSHSHSHLLELACPTQTSTHSLPPPSRRATLTCTSTLAGRS